MKCENNIPQIDAEKIAAMYQLSQDSFEILKFFKEQKYTNTPFKTEIPSEEILKTKRFIDEFNQYNKTVNFLIELHNLAAKVRNDLKETLELTSSINLESMTSQQEAETIRPLDIISSTEILIKDTTDEYFKTYNENTDNIQPIKPSVDLSIKIKMLNSAIKEWYTNKHSLKLHSASRNIIRTTANIVDCLVPKKGRWNNSEDEAISQYHAALIQLIEKAEGQKSLKVKYGTDYCIYIKNIKQIPLPKPKKKWNWFSKNKKVSDYAKLGEE
ncbi:hypothetical protein HOK51_07455 [Candidatus Woesearchaeota archaeon]|nr:hypothetical protein [Candidatus Woesearchaeota archaeon]MBT6519659.1 hypothetical protein [Candidatus Woesearchaeota archaeon]MBT7368695.1 hypothetical protein [Candidatus Woesearchaeota archaeon]